RATLTPEQRAAERAYQREYERKRRAAMTPEQLAADNAYKHQHQFKRTKTPEELEARTLTNPRCDVREPQKAQLEQHESDKQDGDTRAIAAALYQRVDVRGLAGRKLCGHPQFPSENSTDRNLSGGS